MWRLEHGESPAAAGVRVMVLLIGANDLLIAAGDVRDITASCVLSSMLLFAQHASASWGLFAGSRALLTVERSHRSLLRPDRYLLADTPAAHQGQEALDSAVPRAASHIVSVVRRLLEDEHGARVLLMPVLPGGDYSQPLPQRLTYPNRCALDRSAA